MSGNFVQNRSGADFKILTNWKVSFDDEDQHASNWIFWSLKKIPLRAKKLSSLKILRNFEKSGFQKKIFPDFFRIFFGFFSNFFQIFFGFLLPKNLLFTSKKLLFTSEKLLFTSEKLLFTSKKIEKNFFSENPIFRNFWEFWNSKFFKNFWKFFWSQIAWNGRLARFQAAKSTLKGV